MRQGARKEASYLVITIILINEKKRRHTCRCPRDTEPFALESRLTQKNILRSLSKTKSPEAYHKKAILRNSEDSLSSSRLCVLDMESYMLTFKNLALLYLESGRL